MTTQNKYLLSFYKDAIHSYLKKRKWYEFYKKPKLQVHTVEERSMIVLSERQYEIMQALLNDRDATRLLFDLIAGNPRLWQIEPVKQATDYMPATTNLIKNSSELDEK